MKTLALKEFKSLQESDLFSITKVEWWLLKHETYYKDLKTYWYCPNKGCIEQFTKNCFCENKHDEYIFLNLFRELDEFSKYYRKEVYFKQELETYHKVKNDQVKLKELIIRNESIGAEEYFLFLIYHHDYCANPLHLKVLDNTLLGYEVFVDRTDFSNTIDFLNIFSKLFWEDEIFPESKVLIKVKKGLIYE